MIRRPKTFSDNKEEKTMGEFRGGPRRDFGQRQMHKATCAECGKECEVPFKPTEGRDVFCKECFSKRRSSRY